MQTQIYLKPNGGYLIRNRGSIGTVELLNVLKAVKVSIDKSRRSIEFDRKKFAGDTLLVIDAANIELRPGRLRAKDLISSIDSLEKQLATETVQIN